MSEPKATITDSFQAHPERLIDKLNIDRPERILVLPYNTLRIFDALVQVEICKAKDEKWYEPLDEVIYKVLTRKEKDLGKHNGVDSKIVKDLMEADWTRYYEIAPRSKVYDIISILQNQRFVKDVVALFHKKDAVDSALRCDYYDGTIEELEYYIKNNGITTIFMDDVELLKTLIDRGNVDMNWKTIFISKIGYNYYQDKNGILLMKYMEELSSKACMEIASIALTNFTEDFLKRRFSK